MDCKKAFNCVSHPILQDKLQYKFGIGGPLLTWLINYLKQFTTINGKESSVTSVKSGIPQGSVLQPTLFVLYMNDLPTAVKLVTVYRSQLHSTDPSKNSTLVASLTGSPPPHQMRRNAAL